MRSRKLRHLSLKHYQYTLTSWKTLSALQSVSEAAVYVKHVGTNRQTVHSEEHFEKIGLKETSKVFNVEPETLNLMTLLGLYN